MPSRVQIPFPQIQALFPVREPVLLRSHPLHRRGRDGLRGSPADHFTVAGALGRHPGSLPNALPGVLTAVGHMTQYDAIAGDYRDSKQLPFRSFVERYTLFRMLGDVRGRTVLDLACGDGFYARLLMRAGAAAVVGVDISDEMIRLAREEERRQPLGCVYRRGDAAGIEPDEPVDLVVAMYLLNYAETPGELARFCRVVHDALRPGGRVVGFNDNVLNPPSRGGSPGKYGFERTCGTSPPSEGDVILYTFAGSDGKPFRFRNFFLSPETYDDAFRTAGFRDFRWVPAALDPAVRPRPRRRIR